MEESEEENDTSLTRMNRSDASIGNNSSHSSSRNSSGESTSSDNDDDDDYSYAYCGSVDTVYSFQLEQEGPSFVQFASPDFVTISIKRDSQRASESTQHDEDVNNNNLSLKEEEEEMKGLRNSFISDENPENNNLKFQKQTAQGHETAAEEEDDDDDNDSDDENGTFFIYRGHERYKAHIDPNVVTKVKIHKSVGTVLPNRAFQKCSILCQVQLPQKSGLLKIGMGAFEDCIQLQEIEIPPTVIEIQTNAFWCCKSLKHLTLPEGFRIVGVGAFAFCTSLETVVYPSTLKDIRDGAFHWNCELTTVYLKEGLRMIGKDAFSHCESLVNVNIPRTVKQISKGCFDGCKQLLSVEMSSSSSLHTIENFAFHMCESLRLVYHETHVQVEPAAFGACKSLLEAVAAVQNKYEQDDEETTATMEQIQNWMGHTMAHRFDHLPLHRLCYRQACESAENKVTHDERIAQILQHSKETATSIDLVDEYGTTALHILALSVRPNVTLFQRLQEPVYPKAALMVQDRWKTTPLECLCHNRAPGTREMLQSMMEWGFQSRIQYLGLVQWKQEVQFEMDGFVMGDLFGSNNNNNTSHINGNNNNNNNSTLVSERREQLHQFLLKLLNYERLEALSLLECALWKSKLLLLEQAREILGEIDSSTTTYDEIIISQNVNEQDRRSLCRFRCGADVVIVNVLLFLGPVMLPVVKPEALQG